MAINYLQRVQALRQNQGQSDVERGIASGEAIGKLLGNLGTAIQGAQKNALANKLMTDQDIANQPGAGQTQHLGTLSGGPQPGPPRADLVNSGPDPDPDPTSVTYPSGGGVSVGGSIDGRPDMSAQPTYTTEDMPDLSQAVAQQKAVTSLSAQPPPPSGDNWSLSGFGSGGSAGSVGEGQFPGGSSAGAGTVGGLIHTGGVQELDLQKEILAQQIQKASLADKIAEAAGTGRYARRALPVTARGVTMTGDSVWDQSSGPSSSEAKKPTKYEAGSGNFETDETTDNPVQIKTDFEAFNPGINLGDLSATSRAPNGDYVIPGKPDAAGNPTVKATIPKAQGDIVMMRMDAARKRAGLESTNAAIPAGQGTQDNPVPLTSKLMFRSLKRDTWVQDKNGKKFRVGM